MDFNLRCGLLCCENGTFISFIGEKRASMENYDPMQDLYRRAIDFLFKQGITVVVSILFLCVTLGAVRLMWGKMERMEAAFEARIQQNNRDWKTALDISRQETRDCDAKRHELAMMVAELAAEIRTLKGRKK